MKIFRKLLFPFSLLYGTILSFRNTCYDKNWLKSKSYAIPIVCVGNLSTGGTGKSPMIEYLLRFLKEDYKIAVLSRGYKRKTTGFREVYITSKVEDVGDEPLQIKKKFPNIVVAVCANRQEGIDRIKSNVDAILLDDAFQHRKVKPGLSILLTAYDNLFCDDVILPSGNLREPRTGVQRAQTVIVTKSPNNLSSIEKDNIAKRLALHPNQNLFFSSIVYSSEIVSKTDSIFLEELKTKNFTLVTGIANAKPLVNYLKRLNLNFEHLEYDDHHEFSKKELKEISSKSFVLTTEKDFSRLQSLQHKTLYYLPITTQIHDVSTLEKIVKDFIKNS